MAEIPQAVDVYQTMEVREVKTPQQELPDFLVT